jgi:predicted ATP-grasp superfamily ATP-dependent carboligase
LGVATLNGESILVTEDAPAYAVLAGVRGLRAAGYEPWVAIGAHPSYAARSRAAAGVVRVPDPATDRDAYVAALAREAAAHDVRAVIPGTEVALLALAGSQPAFPGGVVVAPSDAAMVARATNKLRLEEFAAAAGLSSPPTIRMTAEEIRSGRKVALPAIVKAPRSSTPTGEGGFDAARVTRATTREELLAAVAELPVEAALIQPALDGDLAAVVGVAWKGEVVATSHQRSTRVFPPGAGISAFAMTVPRDPELDAGVRRLLGAIEWSGIFQVQFIRSGPNSYAIDLNPRMYGSLALAIAAGLNLPGIWADLLLGRAPTVGDYRPGVRFRSEERELSALAGAVSSGDWGLVAGILRPRRGTTHAVASLRDPLPLVTLVQRLGRARRALEAVV